MAHSALIIKLAAIGDVVMALSMVTAIRARHPDAHVAWMVGRVAEPLLRCVEGIDEVIGVDEAAMLAGATPAKLVAVLAAWGKIAGRRFDAVYVAHSDARYNLLGWPVRAATRRGLSDRRGRSTIVPGRSHADEYVRLVTGIDDYRAVGFPPPRVRAELSPRLASRVQAANPDCRPLVAITPGGARNVARESPLRRWPLDRYATLASELDALGYRVVLTGNRADGWVRSAFRSVAALDLIGATDLPALASLLRQCALVIGHDSGPLHLARLVGVPVVVLLGPTPPTMFFREERNVTVMWPGRALSCAPCYNGYEFAECGENICMHMIDVETVLQCAKRVLDAPREVAAA